MRSPSSECRDTFLLNLTSVLSFSQILISGGSTSVGHHAVQIAVLSGLRVLATASPSSHALLKSYGVAETFDYRDPDLVKKIKVRFGRAFDFSRRVADFAFSSFSSFLLAPVPSPPFNLPLLIFKAATKDGKGVKYAYDTSAKEETVAFCVGAFLVSFLSSRQPSDPTISLNSSHFLFTQIPSSPKEERSSLPSHSRRRARRVEPTLTSASRSFTRPSTRRYVFPFMPTSFSKENLPSDFSSQLTYYGNVFPHNDDAETTLTWVTQELPALLSGWDSKAGGSPLYKGQNLRKEKGGLEGKLKRRALSRRRVRNFSS